ncbi:MAG TPA: methyltransferase domain-containing protein [Vicinamibacteria bacterium]|nr:methyltransferase domain-containing protein [Vicinamibacteria bacterium]
MSNPAETYESYMVPTFFGPWAAHLIQSVDPRPGERVLDAACGTGIVARRARARVGPTGTVIGLDLNPDMLTVARASAAREGVAVEWREGRVEQLPFPDRSFDLVLCQAGLMFFADRPAALTEMRRVLTDAGRACASVLQGLDRHPFYQTLHEKIQERLGMSGVSEIFALGDSDGLRELVMAAGFRTVTVQPVTVTARFPDPDSFLAGEIDVDTAAIPSMQHLDDQARRATVAAIRDDMEAPLREAIESDYVVIPFHTWIVGASP